MRAFFLGGFLFCLLLTTVEAAQATTRGDQTVQQQTKMRAQIEKAMRAKRVVQVKVQSGAVIKGTVQTVAADYFKLREAGSQFIRDIAYTEIVTVKVQSRLETAMGNTGKVLNFLFFTRAGLALTATALTVARLIIWNRRAQSREGVLIKKEV